MAYWIDESTVVGNSRQIKFFVDADSDISSLPTTTISGVQQGENEISCLPCGCGSRAISIESGNVFFLKSNNKWVKMSKGGGSDSGGSSDVVISSDYTFYDDGDGNISVIAN